MKSNYIVLLGILLAFSACEGNEPEPMPQIRGEVNLTVPLSRQMTMYQKFTHYCPGGSFVKATDTIILKVVLEDGKKFFDEYGTQGSESAEVRDHRTRMPITIEIDVLRIFDRSNSYLFASLPSDKILVDSTYTGMLWQDDCSVVTTSDSTIFEGDQPGLIALFAIDTVQIFDQKLMTAGAHEQGIANKYVMYDGAHLYMSYHEEFNLGQPYRLNGWLRIEP